MSLDEGLIEEAHLEGAARDALTSRGFTAQQTEEVFKMADFADRLREEATRT